MHPDFDISPNDFSRLLKDLPEAAKADPQRFLELASGMLDMEPWRLVLVDKNHSLTGDFKSGELVNLSDYPEIPLGRSDLSLDRLTAEALVKLCIAARQDGVTLLVSSAYRSWEYQQKLFTRYAARDGEEAASRYSARPGESQHQLGTTVDFGDISNRFASQDAGKWIVEYGNIFGWSLSYPRNGEQSTGYKWESWHWRYVGTDATEMQTRFFNNSQQAMFEFWNLNSEILREFRF